LVMCMYNLRAAKFLLMQYCNWSENIILLLLVKTITTTMCNCLYFFVFETKNDCIFFLWKW
jgi:hypothetical protein